MAAKDTVSNVFGGFTIFTDRPFSLNDRIRISGFDGTIQEIGLRSTRLRTTAGTLVTIPNSKFADTPVENVSEEPNRKVTLNLGLTYDTTPAKMGYLREITASHDNLEPRRSIPRPSAVVLTPEVIDALAALAHFNEPRRALMADRLKLREERARNRQRITFLEPGARIPGTNITVQEAREGKFVGSKMGAALFRQTIQ